MALSHRQRTWPGTPDDVSRARGYVTTQLLALGLPELVREAQLIISELTSNVVQHAGTAFRLTVDGDDQGLLLRVRDWSTRPINPTSADPGAEGGRGLMLVDALSVSWGVTPHENGKSVWAELAAHRSDGPLRGDTEQRRAAVPRGRPRLAAPDLRA